MAKLPSTNIQTSKERKYKQRSRKRGIEESRHTERKTIPHHGMNAWVEEMALKPKSSIATDQSMALSNLALKKEKSMRLLN